MGSTRHTVPPACTLAFSGWRSLSAKTYGSGLIAWPSRTTIANPRLAGYEVARPAPTAHVQLVGSVERQATVVELSEDDGPKALVVHPATSSRPLTAGLQRVKPDARRVRRPDASKRNRAVRPAPCVGLPRGGASDRLPSPSPALPARSRCRLQRHRPAAPLTPDQRLPHHLRPWTAAASC